MLSSIYATPVLYSCVRKSVVNDQYQHETTLFVQPQIKCLQKVLQRYHFFLIDTWKVLPPYKTLYYTMMK